MGLRAFRLLALVPAWLSITGASVLIAYAIFPEIPYGQVGVAIARIVAILCLCAAISPFLLLIWLKYWAETLSLAWQMRANDILVSNEGIRIVGGRAHGYEASWRSLTGTSGIRLCADSLGLGQGPTPPLAIPDDPDERASIEALAATLAARAEATQTTDRRLPARRCPPDVLSCRGCGAPLVPADASHIACRHCGIETEVPPQLADKIRAMQRLAARRVGEARLTKVLFAQPSALVANGAVFVGGFLMIGVGFVALISASVAGLFQDGHELGMDSSGGPFGVAVIGIALLLVSAVRHVLAQRYALRLLTLGFSARPPARQGDPLVCRSCSGPLPEPEHSGAMAHCLYCGASNVMATDLRPQADIVQQFSAGADEPDQVLASYRAQRRRHRLRMGFAFMLIATGAAWHLMQMGSNIPPERAPEATSIPFDDAIRDWELRRMRRHVEATASALASERVARMGDTEAWLWADEHGGVDAIVRKDETSYWLASVRGDAVPIDAFENPDIRGPWFRRDDDAIVYVADRGLRVRLSNGTDQHWYPASWVHDRVVVDVSPGPGGDVLATTRASPEGRFTIRRIAEDGTSQILMRNARDPALSPDGTKLAATRLVDPSPDNQHEGRFHIVVADMARLDAPIQLVHGRGHTALPVWSPDGERLAFLTRSVKGNGARFGRQDLWVVDLRGRAEPLTTGQSLEFVRPVWTSEGIWVVTREPIGRDPEGMHGLAYSTVLWRLTVP